MVVKGKSYLIFHMRYKKNRQNINIFLENLTLTMVVYFQIVIKSKECRKRRKMFDLFCTITPNGTLYFFALTIEVKWPGPFIRITLKKISELRNKYEFSLKGVLGEEQ